MSPCQAKEEHQMRTGLAEKEIATASSGGGIPHTLPACPAMDSISLNQSHFLLIPFFAQGHIIPFAHLAKILARRNQIVSIITTPANFLRYDQSITSGAAGIRLISVDFPGPQLGLPLGVENMDSVTSILGFKQFFDACTLMKDSVVKAIQSMDPSPNCIVSSNSLPWTHDLAEIFCIPRYIFETVSCFTIVCTQNMARNPDSETFSVSDIPHKIEFTKSQFPEVPNEIGSQIETSRLCASGSLMNTFHEMED
ncbi:hypothetical protein M569_03287, partial [Genlisea aurea]